MCLLLRRGAYRHHTKAAHRTATGPRLRGPPLHVQRRDGKEHRGGELLRAACRGCFIANATQRSHRRRSAECSMNAVHSPLLPEHVGRPIFAMLENRVVSKFRSFVGCQTEATTVLA